MKKKILLKIIVTILVLIILWFIVFVFILNGRMGVVFIKKVGEFKSNEVHENGGYDPFYRYTKNDYISIDAIEKMKEKGYVYKESNNKRLWEIDEYNQVITSNDPIAVLTFDPFEDPEYRSYSVVKGKREDEYATLYVYLTNYKHTIRYVP